jgi:S-adenosyl methyltransferase
VTASSVPFDASKPHIARVYDYLLGGKDNFAADRAVGDRMLASIPEVQLGVRAQRDVLGRVVRCLVGEVGLRQLLDIGSGLPTADNVHEIAQRIDPATRVVYLDNDPIVLSHAEALLADETMTFVVDGDLRDPRCRLAATSSSTTCWPPRTRPRSSCRSRCAPAWGGPSSGPWIRSGSCSTGWSSSNPAWCSCPTGVLNPRRSVTIPSWRWPASASPASRSRSGVGGHTHPVGPTAYKLREGSHVDPDGNLIRFGSPVKE